MNSSPSRFTSIGLLILRVAFGCMMLFGHGLPKLMSFADKADGFADPIGLGSRLSMILAIGAEAGCSLLLIIGLATRLAAIPLAFTMAVALLIVHASDSWQTKELAAVYLAGFVSLIFTGGGTFALDHTFWKKKTTRTTEKAERANS